MTREGTKRLLTNGNFWLLGAYVLLAVGFVGLWLNFARVSSAQLRTTRDEAIHHADIVANADAQFKACTDSIPTLTHFNVFVDSELLVAQTLLDASLRSHAVTPPHTALWKAQRENIAGFRRALKASEQTVLPVPTTATCKALRKHLLKQP
jgi:hypothetical protein